MSQRIEVNNCKCILLYSLWAWLCVCHSHDRCVFTQWLTVCKSLLLSTGGTSLSLREAPSGFWMCFLPSNMICQNTQHCIHHYRSWFSIPTVLETFWFWKEQKRRKAQQLRDRKTLVYTFCDYCMIFLVFVVGKFETADTGRAWWGESVSESRWEWRWWRGRGLPSSGSRWVSRWVSAVHKWCSLSLQRTMQSMSDRWKSSWWRPPALRGNIWWFTG